jgi:uncharacterized membrane protein YedE/YeeE
MTLQSIKVFIAALAAGLLFGFGLIVSGMTNPAKVVGFLDIAGSWDPSLILVMAAGLMITTPAFYFASKSLRPLLGLKFDLPSRTDIDRPLIIGSAMFGVGWGLAGYCPGPALTAATSLNTNVLLFVVAMACGMLAQKLWSKA